MVAAGLLSLTLISTLALHPSHPLKAWAGSVHNALGPAPAQGPQPSGPDGTALASPVSPAQLHGLPCLMQQATTMLNSMWHFGQPTDQSAPKAPSCLVDLGTDQSPLAWLGRFQKALQTLRDKQSEQAQERVLSSHQDEVMRMILTALLDHPQLGVQAAAAEAAAEAVKAFPVTGISLLPLLLYKLQRSVAVAQQGESRMLLLPSPLSVPLPGQHRLVMPRSPVAACADPHIPQPPSTLTPSFAPLSFPLSHPLTV